MGVLPEFIELPAGRAAVASVFWIVTPVTFAFIIDGQSSPAADAVHAVPANSSVNTHAL
jgi:hypothetical protein